MPAEADIRAFAASMAPVTPAQVGIQAGSRLQRRALHGNSGSAARHATSMRSRRA